jgi:peptidylglycine monooxygenase
MRDMTTVPDSAASMERGQIALAGRRYSVERDFGRLPTGMASARVSQVAVDSEGHVHVLRRGNPPVLVFTPDGGFVRAYGAGVIFDSHGLSIDAQDRVWVVDRDAHEVVVFDMTGQTVLKLGERHEPRWAQPFNHPTRAAVAADGEIYVADGYGNARVHRFSREGHWIASFGEVGHGPGEFMTPHSVIVDRRDRVLVCDRENDRIQVFDRAGGWLMDWRGLCRPMMVPDVGAIVDPRSAGHTEGAQAREVRLSIAGLRRRDHHKIARAIHRHEGLRRVDVALHLRRGERQRLRLDRRHRQARPRGSAAVPQFVDQMLRALGRRARRQKFAEGRKGFRSHGFNSETDHAETLQGCVLSQRRAISSRLPMGAKRRGRRPDSIPARDRQRLPSRCP